MSTTTLNSSIITPELVQLVKDGQVTSRFRFELLDKANSSKAFLNCVLEGGEVTNNYLNDIKRTAKFTIAEVGNFSAINFLNDRVKVYCDIYDIYADNWLSYALGVFVLSAGTRVSGNGVITRDVEGYDLTQVLKRTKHLERFVVATGSDPIAVVQQLIVAAGLTSEIKANDNTDPGEITADLTKAERSYDPGSEYIITINDLLDMVGYRSLWFDENGVARSAVYSSPDDRGADIGYVTDSLSILAEGANLTEDTFDVPNIIQVIVSQTDRAPIVGLARNDNPDSPTSTVNIGEITQVYSDNEDVTTQAQADAKAARLLVEASQIYQKISFETGIVPVHTENSIISIEHTDLDVSANFSEISWSITLKSGSTMKHEARRTVRI